MKVIAGTLHEDLCTHVYDSLSLFQTDVVEKIKTCIYMFNTFIENHAVCEVMCKNTLEPEGTEMTV